MRRNVAIAVGALATLPFLVTIGYGFVLDDVSVIAGNSALHAPSGVLTAWTSSFVPTTLFGEVGRYRPVSGSFFAILWLLGGGHPWLFHLASIAAHVGVALGVLKLLERVIPAPWAAAGASLFAVMPVHVEAVANIIGSSESLVALGALGFAFAIWRGATADDGQSPLGMRTALTAAAAYALALGAKESGAGAPAIGLALWWGWREPSETAAPGIWSLIRRGMKVWIASTLVLIGYAAARTAVIGGAALTAVAGDQPWRDRVWTTMATWPTVAQLLTIPGALRSHYRETDPHAASVTPNALLGIGIVLALIALALFWLRRGDRRPVTALAFFGLAFLPGSNLIIPIKQLLGERNLYGASIGAAMLGAWILAKSATRVRARVVGAVAGALILFGLVRSAGGALAWESNPDLWAHAIAADSLDYKPQWSLGIWYLLRGDLRHGAPLVERAHLLAPSEIQVATDYAQVLQAEGLMDSSLAVLRAALRIEPTSRHVRDVYLTTLIRAGRADSALADLRASGAADPLGASRYRLIAQAHDARGAKDSAIVYFRLAIDSAADSYELRLIEAVVLERAGRMAEGQRVRASMEEQRSPTAAEAATIRLRTREALELRPAN